MFKDIRILKFTALLIWLYWEGRDHPWKWSRIFVSEYKLLLSLYNITPGTFIFTWPPYVPRWNKLGQYLPLLNKAIFVISRGRCIPNSTGIANWCITNAARLLNKFCISPLMGVFQLHRSCKSMHNKCHKITEHVLHFTSYGCVKQLHSLVFKIDLNNEERFPENVCQYTVQYILNFIELEAIVNFNCFVCFLS